jgi:hypothetical protein
MLGVAKVTSGIGVRTARSIPCIYTKRPIENRLQTSVNSAKQRKKTATARYKIVEFISK